MQIRISAFALIGSLLAVACASESPSPSPSPSPSSASEHPGAEMPPSSMDDASSTATATFAIQSGEWRSCLYFHNPSDVVSNTWQMAVSGTRVRFTSTRKTEAESFYEGDLDGERHLVSTWNQKSGESTVVSRGYFSPDGRRFSGDRVYIDAKGIEYEDDAYVMFVNDGATTCPAAP